MYWAVTALRNWKQIRAQIEHFISMSICIIIKYPTHELQGTSRNEETKVMPHNFRNLLALGKVQYNG